jgi:apolipoprotein N-acyltransferase
MLMSRYKYSNTIALCLSAVLVFIAVLEINFIIAWICFVPAFIVLQNSKKSRIKEGVIFGSTLSLISFYWMIPGAQRFTGSGVVYGVAVFLISSLILVSYWTLLFALFTFLQRSVKKNADVVINAVMAGCIWVLGEALLALVSLRMPWFLFRTGISVSGNLYAIQPISFFGVSIATFFIVVVNYLIAYCITTKKYNLLFIPAVIVVFYLGSGFVILTYFQQQKNTLKPIKAAVLTENIPPEMRWDESSGNALVNRLLGLAKASVVLQPDIAVWSESTVPWTYRPNDDFVNEVLRITKPQNITNILGINSDADSAVVYNSVYAILPNGKVTSRYDKRYLLGFIEQPVAGVIFPFLSSGGYMVKPGNNSQPLQTPYGKVGILICNESTVSAAAADLVNNGAQFILNLSNDGWFSDTYIADQHFYNARLRAVETRKDIVVNSNDGITGLIKASGEIVSAKRSNEPNADIAMIQPNNFTSLATSSPYIMLYLSGIFVIINLFIALRIKLSKQ